MELEPTTLNLSNFIKVPPGTYQLAINPELFNQDAQNTARIVVDTSTGPYTFIMPKISTLKGLWNLKIIVVDKSGEMIAPVSFQAALNPPSQDKFTGLGAPIFVIAESRTSKVSIEVADDNVWAIEGVVPDQVNSYNP